MTGPAGEAADAAIGVDLGGTKALAAAVVGGSVVATREAHTGRGLGPSQATELVARLVGGGLGAATLATAAALGPAVDLWLRAIEGLPFEPEGVAAWVLLVVGVLLVLAVLASR